MLYNSAADSFRTKQLCSRLSQRYRAKTDIKRSLCVFETPHGGLEAGYDVHLRLIGKRAVDFLLVIMNFFRQLLCLWSYERIQTGKRRFRRGWVTLMQNFRYKGTSPPTICAWIVHANECLTSVLLKVFTQRNFVADFLREKSNFLYGKRKNCRL